MYKIRCFYDQFNSGILFDRCRVIDEHNQYIGSSEKVYEYLMHTLMSDIYLPKDIDKHFKIIEYIENNPNEIYDDGGGQQFCLEFHHNQVIFYHNEFDEEDGFPVLSCSLQTFKTALIAWNAFLQLPKSLYSVVETVIEE